MSQNQELLFNQIDLIAIAEVQKQKIIRAIDEINSNKLLQSATDTLCELFEREYKLEAPKLDKENISTRQEEAKVDVSHDPNRFIRDRSKPFYVDGIRVTFYVPYSGNKDLFKCRPSTFTTTLPRAQVGDREVVVYYELVSPNAQQVRTLFQRDLSEIEKHLSWVENDVSVYNEAIRSTIKTRIEMRKRRISEVKGIATELGFIMREMEETTDVHTDTPKVLSPDNSKKRKSRAKSTPRTPARLLNIFLCHSSDDKPAVRDLYWKLKSHSGLKPWLDEEDLVTGQDWELEIRKAVKNSDVIVVCLSNGSINKRGFVQKEIKYALDVADEQPEGTIFLIPLRLEECEVPDRLRSKHWVDYSRSDGYERLLAALRARAQGLGIESLNSVSGKGRRRKTTKAGSSIYVRRDAQGRFYESDDTGRSLKLDAESHKKEEAPSRKSSKKRKKRLTQRDWNDSKVACSLLSDIGGLQTGDYKSSGTEDDFFCCSHYKDLDHESPLPNNIAYYAEGDGEEVNRLKLVLNVNEPEKAEEAHRALMTYSSELARKALGQELSPKMQEAILAGHPEAYTVGELFVELKREAWPTGQGYEMKFIITQPISM